MWRCTLIHHDEDVNITPLARPVAEAQLALVSDASNSAMGAVLQHRVGGDW